MRFALLIFSFVFCALPIFAMADDQLTPLDINGDWAAFEHRQSLDDPPDICVAAEVEDQFFLRADNNDIEVRYSNDSWSLPTGVTGEIILSVNGNNFSLDITDNTNDMVIAAITQDQLQKIVADMNNASTMTITAGSASPATISLTGSNQVVTAFLTCANISQPGNTGGVNPFQGSGSGGNSQ